MEPIKSGASDRHDDRPATYNMQGANVGMMGVNRNSKHPSNDGCYFSALFIGNYL